MTGRTHTSLTLALTLLNAGQLEECLEELDRCPESTSLSPEFIRVRGDVLVRLSRWAELDALVEALPTHDAHMRSLAAILRSRSEIPRGLRESALTRLATTDLCGDPETDALHMSLKGTCEVRLGFFPAACVSLRAAIGQFERTRNQLGIAECLNGLGVAQRMMARYEIAESCFRSAHDLARDAGSIREMAISALNLGTVYVARGRLISATESYQRALAMAREVGAGSAATWATLGLGLVAIRRGRAESGFGQLVTGLTECRRNHWLRHQVAAYEYLGEYRLTQARYDVARRHLHRAVRIGRTIGDPQAQFEPQYRLAEAELALGNAALARTLAVEARDDFAGRGDRLEAAFAARVAAQALLCLGDPASALTELEAVRATLEELGEQFEIHRVDRLLRAARENAPIVDIRLEERNLRLPETAESDAAGDDTPAPTSNGADTAGNSRFPATIGDRARGTGDALGSSSAAGGTDAGHAQASPLGSPPRSPLGANLPSTPQPTAAPSAPPSPSAPSAPMAVVRRSAPPATRPVSNRGRSSGRPEPTLVYGVSRVFIDFVAEVDLHAPGSSFILLEGETGVGKELIARRIHALSPRAQGNFVPFNCGTSTPELFDAEFFGHVRGAYTGAQSRRLGLARMADGGTLLLDEIGELVKFSQARLLRFLDTGEIRPVGSDVMDHADVRVISATHRDLDRLVEDREFRSDLLFRLAPLRLRVPPLRERIEDLEILIRYFLDVENPDAGSDADPAAFPDSLLSVMSRYEWPGNIRELRSEVLRIVRQGLNGRADEWKPLSRTSIPKPRRDRREVREIGREEFENALRESAGQAIHAARRLGISRTYVYRLVARFGVDLAAYRS